MSKSYCFLPRRFYTFTATLLNSICFYFSNNFPFKQCLKFLQSPFRQQIFLADKFLAVFSERKQDNIKFPAIEDLFYLVNGFAFGCLVRNTQKNTVLNTNPLRHILVFVGFNLQIWRKDNAENNKGIPNKDSPPLHP